MSHAIPAALAPLPRRVTVAVCAMVVGAIFLAARQTVLLAPVTPNPGLVDAAATLDMTVVATLACWWMLGRTFRWSPVALLPLYFASLFAAGWMLPPGEHAALRWLHLAAAPLEVAALVLVARNLRAGRGRLATVLAYELSVLRWGLFLEKRDDAGPDGISLSYHRKTGYGAMVGVLLLVTAVEVVTMHLLVRTWSERLAWVLTALGVYGAIWVLGDWRACRHRPARAEKGVLRVRFGLRWRLDVPLASVTALRPPTPREMATKRGVDLRLALPGSRWRVLELDPPAEAEGIYGLRRTVRTLGLALDEPTLLDAALEARNDGPTTDGDPS